MTGGADFGLAGRRAAVMALIFATLTGALAALDRDRRRLAVALLLASLLLSAGLFLVEIHSPEDGFRMPWLRVAADAPERSA
jgi:hypothetical protein